MPDLETSKLNSEVSNQIRGKLLFFENYVTSEGAVSNVVYFQQLPITRYQVRFYANSFF